MSETTSFDDKREATKRSLTSRLSIVKRRDYGANLLEAKSTVLPDEVVVECDFCGHGHSIQEPQVPTIWRCRNVECRSRNVAHPVEPNDVVA